MKNKLLLFLLFFLFLGNKINAKNFEQDLNNSKINFQLPLTVNFMDTIKKSNRIFKTAKSTAIIPPPQTTAGSACKEEGVLTVKVAMAASGGSGDVIEWFASQTSTTILHTGPIYSPSISQTTTYYVQTHAGVDDFSIRVPVVASVYTAPPAVTLKAFPQDASLCEGTELIFTAEGGADLFEFYVDGEIVQIMSPDRIFKTSLLKKGQIVSVKTRYAVTFDGSSSEIAYGKGALEDNIFSAALSVSASTGYINSIKISPTENDLVFGIAGKLENNRSMLLFLDTKPGGFNMSNFADVANPALGGFNYFANNLTPSTFDSYFQADYCLVISTDGGGINYVADIIELKNGLSSTILNTSSVTGVNNGNSGIADYNLGFEVGLSKALIGYTAGDIKFFALTIADDNGIVTNSFLSPELSSSLDYGTGAIDYNIKDPNPVVVSADALIPCYKEDSIVVNLDEQPTAAIVGPLQNRCSFTSTSLGGNTPTVGVGKWSLKSGPGSVSFSNENSGSSTATVSTKGTYFFTWTISNGVCPTSAADIEVIFNLSPLAPTASDPLPVCASSPIQTLTATATVQAGESIIWYDTLSGGNIVSDPSLSSVGTITYYAESENITTFCKSDTRTPVSLTIYDSPTIGGALSICIGETTALTGSATADAATPWTSDSTEVATVSSLGVVSGVSAGTSLITYKNNNGCTVTATVTVNALPIITGSLSVCVGATTALSGSATADATTPWVSASPGVATVDNSGVVTGISAGTSVITYKNSNGCTTTETVTVNDLPTITGSLTVCVDATTTLTGSATPDSVSPWISASAGVATIDNSGVVTGISAGTSLITYKNNNGCTITSTVTVYALPVATLSSDDIDNTFCSGTSVTFTAGSGVNYNFRVDGLSVQNGALITYTTAGLTNGQVVDVVVTNASGCTATSAGIINIVNALPTITGSLNVCIGSTTALSGSATADVTNPWESASTGVATVNSSGVVTGISAGTSLITYKNSNGCTTTATVTVDMLPVATLSSDDADNTFCSGTSVTFTATGGASYNFRVDGLSVQNGASTTYVTAGLTEGQVVDVIVTNASGCTSTSTGIANTVNPLPLSPILVIVKQPTCTVATGSFTITNYDASYVYVVNPSVGVSITGNVVTAPTGNYTVTASLGSCSASSIQTINPIPPQIQFEINGDCDDKDYVLTASPLSNSYDPNNVDFEWKDSSGVTVGTNSNVLNVSNLIASTSEIEIFPLNYTLTIISSETGCETTDGVTVQTIYCNIQKGISPDGNGSNEYFDLRLMDVKKLDIFDRYGIKVYSQSDYTDQWKGQSDKGEDLPSATYYYVIEPNEGEAKTGWIYLIREK